MYNTTNTNTDFVPNISIDVTCPQSAVYMHHGKGKVTELIPTQLQEDNLKKMCETCTPRNDESKLLLPYNSAIVRVGCVTFETRDLQRIELFTHKPNSSAYLRRITNKGNVTNIPNVSIDFYNATYEQQVSSIRQALAFCEQYGIQSVMIGNPDPASFYDDKTVNKQEEISKSGLEKMLNELTTTLKK